MLSGFTNDVIRGSQTMLFGVRKRCCRGSRTFIPGFTNDGLWFGVGCCCGSGGATEVAGEVADEGGGAVAVGATRRGADLGLSVTDFTVVGVAFIVVGASRDTDFECGVARFFGGSVAVIIFGASSGGIGFAPLGIGAA